MITLKKPSFEETRRYLEQSAQAEFNYSAVGGTRDGYAPDGYILDRASVVLGQGAATFQAAKQAVRDWQMFPRALAQLHWPVPLEPGGVVAVRFRAPLFWSLNPCRIVYSVDDSIAGPTGPIHRFGFAYGAVVGHIESGEEIFLVEHDLASDMVSYRIECFSRPHHWLAKLAKPYCRWQQARFRRLSCESMQIAVRAGLAAVRGPLLDGGETRTIESNR